MMLNHGRPGSLCDFDDVKAVLVCFGNPQILMMLNQGRPRSLCDFDGVKAVLVGFGNPQILIMLDRPFWWALNFRK